MKNTVAKSEGRGASGRDGGAGQLASSPAIADDGSDIPALTIRVGIKVMAWEDGVGEECIIERVQRSGCIVRAIGPSNTVLFCHWRDLHLCIDQFVNDADALTSEVHTPPADSEAGEPLGEVIADGLAEANDNTQVEDLLRKRAARLLERLPVDTLETVVEALDAHLPMPDPELGEAMAAAAQKAPPTEAGAAVGG